MTSSSSVFEHLDYASYLAKALATSGKSRGLRSKLAGQLGCQPSYITRILKGVAHLSLEQAMTVNRFLNHSEAESDFFLLLVQHSRSGTKELRDHFSSKIQESLRRREAIRERIATRKQLTLEQQVTYYSSWIHSAIHMLLLVPKFQEKQALADYLKVSAATISESLDFLVSTGLATTDGRRYRTGEARLHLSPESPLITKSQTNWKMRAIHALDRKSPEDLSYSGPICLSEADAIRIRKMLLDLIENTEGILKQSPDEAVFCISLDFFRV